MIIPIRCFTCGKLVADKWEDFSKRVKSGEDPGKVLNDLEIQRYCCRRMILSHIELIDELLSYYEETRKRNAENYY
jgi:DNA-directed RNA polymerase subunit N